MHHYSFLNWLQLQEVADFGLIEPFFKRPRPVPLTTNKPEHPLNVEMVINELKRYEMGLKRPRQQFFGEVQWGEEEGAVKVHFTTWGSTRAALRKLSHDLQGNPIWICKKIIEVHNLFDKKENSLAYDLFGDLAKMDNSPTEAPLKDYQKLENLVLDMASSLKANNTQIILLYEGIRVVKQNEEYIIHFGVTGGGVQRLGQKRLDQFDIFVKYFPEHGYIKVNGIELGGPLKSHPWQYEPSTFMEFFMPSQSKKEIINAVLTSLNSY